MGSTHVESQLRDPTGKKVQYSTARDMQPRRRMDTDQTVFKVYKGVKTFDFCKEKNVIVTGGEIILFSDIFNIMDKSRRKVDSRSVMLQCSVPILISILPEKACNFQSNLLEQVRGGTRGKNWSLIVLRKKYQTLHPCSAVEG